MNIINYIKKAYRAIINVVDPNSIVINGKHYSGNSIVVKGNSVYVDGKLTEDCTDGKVINIVINGNTKEVSSISGNITVKGSVEKDVNTTSGDINISGDIEGNVSTISGDIIANTIKGNTSTVSGNIRKKY